ncbi:DUF2332 domain-containing protein [Actinomycetospora lutea]|uniref:DUF2332 domain-containing protein n=1 Tax=Actinomycetospora lutea TaxID=663604 RepID=UPI0023658000|nr:DUF2332 domain-containing protein [Actinomycetospora lutea]MDD7939157.1 DUF2332 domain-containing protein [Actinomycetospora lutea]
MGRTLAQRYRHAGEVEAAGFLHQRVALALSESDEALRALGTLPARRRSPDRVLAALHDLALAGRAPALAAAYAAGDHDAAARAAVATLREMPEAVADGAATTPRPGETGRAPVLLPAIAEATQRVGAAAVGLVDVGCSAGFDLVVDRVGVTYDGGPTLGDPSSPVQRSASVVGERPLPARALPPVVARIGVDDDPVDVTDTDQARRLRAAVPPDHHERAAALDAEITLAGATGKVLLRGDPVDLLPDALAHVPADALPVVTTTWTLSALPLERRLRFLQRLDAAATDRPVAWVSAEGVGVAPAVPTLGDRPASGHSILGLVVLEHRVMRAEALGRCWSRGRMLSWLAG